MKRIGHVFQLIKKLFRRGFRRIGSLKPSIELGGVVSNGHVDSPLIVVWPDNVAPVKKIDWSPLAGRKVIFHPEHSSGKEAS